MSAVPDLSTTLAAEAGRQTAARRWSYVVATVAVALTGAWAVWAHLGHDSLVVALMAAICLTALSAVDARLRRLPNVGTLSAAGLALFSAFLADGAAGLGRAALGATATFLVLFVIKATLSRSIGWGDVKLGLALGAFGGFFGVWVVVFGLCFGIILNGLVGALFLVTRHAQWGARLALGPSLSIGLLGAIALV